tara:strand:+ start:365 stop:895 length:531 start_codon:yes stop_codon:yes gene_type:complete
MYAVHRICHHPDSAPRLIENYGRCDRPILSKIAHRLLITRQEVVSILLSQAQKGNDGSQVECGIAQTTVDPIDQHRITRRCEDDVSRVQVEVARVPRCVLQFLVESPHILGGAGHPRWPGRAPLPGALLVSVESLEGGRWRRDLDLGAMESTQSLGEALPHRRIADVVHGECLTGV